MIFFLRFERLLKQKNYLFNCSQRAFSDYKITFGPYCLKKSSHQKIKTKINYKTNRLLHSESKNRENVHFLIINTCVFKVLHILTIIITIYLKYFTNIDSCLYFVYKYTIKIVACSDFFTNYLKSFSIDSMKRHRKNYTFLTQMQNCYKFTTEMIQKQYV